MSAEGTKAMTREKLIEVMADAIDLAVDVRGDAGKAATAALAAIEAAGVRLVPSEPNENMHDAFFHTRDHAWPKHRDERRAEGKGWRTLPYAIWDAMIAASPYAPPGG